jgi:ribosome-associated protein
MTPEPVAVREEPIRLGQFLKLAGVVDSGSDSRFLLEDEAVRVGGEVESRRGRQLVRGDVVTVALPSGERAFLVS